MYNRNTSILIIIFNRPEAAKKVLDSVRIVRPRKLYIAADGPRAQHPSDLELCLASRLISTMVDWECDVSTLYRESNLGCKFAVSDSISWFYSFESEGIILEDDCIPNSSFFDFSSELLEKYRDEPKVMHIGGQNFLKIKKGEHSSKSFYFSHYPHIWGWATWRRSWIHFNDTEGLDNEQLREMIISRFKNRSQGNKLFKNYILARDGKLNTWDYHWQVSILINNGLAITPFYNMVVNIGLDYTGTHSFIKDSFRDNSLYENMPFPIVPPGEMVIDYELDRDEYQNVLSHGLVRFVRLVGENRLPLVLKHLKKHLKSYFS